MYIFILLVFSLSLVYDTESQFEPATPCILLSKTKGPCHDCVCSDLGHYACKVHKCNHIPYDEPLEVKPNECTPKMSYQADTLICTCSLKGHWFTTTCRETFREMLVSQPKKLSLGKSPRITCTPGTYYLIDCNFCLCGRDSTIDMSQCSSNVCSRGSLGGKCTRGNIMKQNNKLCICNEDGEYNADSCIKITKEDIQMIDIKAVHKLFIDSDKILTDKCKTPSVIHIDCNKCVCDDNGGWACTDSMCVDQDKWNLDDTESAKLRSNTEIGGNNTEEDNMKIQARQSEVSLDQVPNIAEGEPCETGKIYKMDCNTCTCHENNELICSKMMCLKGHASYMQQKRQKNRAHMPLTRRPQRHKRDVTENKEDPKNGNCKQGKIYDLTDKGGTCRTCFCDDRMKLDCNTIPCDKRRLNKRRASPDDFRDFTETERGDLQRLPNRAVECVAGRYYLLDCNVCLCHESGNLLCDHKLCLSFAEVNRVRALKLSRLPCSEMKSEKCVTCSCEGEQTKCTVVVGCQPEVVRAEHGPLRENSHYRVRYTLDPAIDQCVPGLVYIQDCNNCYCQDNGSLRCTMKLCLNFELSKMVEFHKRKTLDNNV